MKTVGQIDAEMDRAIAKLGLTKRQAKLAKAFIELTKALNDNGIYPVDGNDITLIVTPDVAGSLRAALGCALFGSDKEFKGIGYDFKVEARLN